MADKWIIPLFYYERNSRSSRDHRAAAERSGHRGPPSTRFPMFREPVPDGHPRNGRHLLSVRGRLSRRPHSRALLGRCTGNLTFLHLMISTFVNQRPKWIVFRAIDWPVSANASGQSAAESGVPWLPATPKSSSPGKYYCTRQAHSPVAFETPLVDVSSTKSIDKIPVNRCLTLTRILRLF